MAGVGAGRVDEDLVWATPGTELREAAQLMFTHRVSSLLVGAPGEEVEILTERDLARALAEDWPHDTPIRQLASSRPVAIDVTGTINDAATLMLQHDVRHLVVTRDHKVVGIVSARDVLGALLSAAQAPMLVELMRHCVETRTEIWLG